MSTNYDVAASATPSATESGWTDARRDAVRIDEGQTAIATAAVADPTVEVAPPSATEPSVVVDTTVTDVFDVQPMPLPGVSAAVPIPFSARAAATPTAAVAPVYVTVSDPTVDETQGTMTFVVKLTSAASDTVTVSYATANVTAGYNYDYQAASGTLTFLAGETSKSVSVPVLNDTGVEATEYLKLNLSSAVNATIVKDFGWGTIVDNDAATGTPVIQVGDQVVDEAAGTVSFVVTLDRPSTGIVKVDVATVAGTAAGGSDYTSLAAQTLTFSAGQTAKTVTVALTNDTTKEGAEYFDLKLSNAVGGTFTSQPYGRVTIGANDAAAVDTPLIKVSDPTVDETQSLMEFVVTLSAPSAQTVTVDYGTSNVTAGYNYDYQATSGRLTFLAGETTKVVKVPMYGDTGVEATEYLKLNLSGAVNATIVKDFGWGTIVDNDAPTGTPIIQVGDQVVDEAAGTVSFVVTLDRPSTGTVKVDVATADGSALAGSDYTALAAQTLTFLAGQTAKTVTVALTNDTAAEGRETFDLKLSNAVGGTFTSQPYGRVTIGANDAAAVDTPLIKVSDPTVDETQTLMEFVVTLNAPSAQTVTVDYGTSNVTAGYNYDYQATSGKLTFLAGETTKVVKVPMYGDTGVEATEYLKLNLSSAVNATIVKDFGWGTIVDNDAATGTPVIQVGDQIVDEAAGTVSFVVTLDRPSTGTVKVDVATANGSAVAGSDYTALATQTLTFLAGQTAKTVTVALTNDTAAEGNETFDLKLSNAVGGTFTSQPYGRVTIGANDAAAVDTPLIKVSDPTVDETQSLMEFVVTLSAPSAQTVTVDYGTSNVTAGYNYDYQATSGRLTFLAGETTKVVKVPMYGDTGVEATEYLKLNLSGAVNATIVKDFGWGTIVDNDAPTGTPIIQVGDQVVDEAAGTVSFVVTLDRPSTGTVKVDVATADGSALAGSDYTALAAQTLTFLAGQTAKTVTVALTNDTAAEGRETFDLKLSNAVGGTFTSQPYGRVTIGANDAAAVDTPLIKVSDPTVDETQTLMEFVVTLNAPSAQTVTVDYGTSNVTAGYNYDYQATSGRLTFLAGETTKVVKVPMYGDTGVEATEYLKLNLSSAVNATIVKDFGWGTIVDNDAATGTPVIQVGDQIVDEAAGTVSFVVTLDRPSTGTVKVDVATANGSAVAGSDYTALATQTLTFLAGQTAKTVTVALTNDTAAEGAEYFDLKLANAVNGSIADANGRVFIGGGDGTAAVTPLLSISDPTVGETQSLMEFVVTLSAPSAQTVTVNYGTSNVTAGYNYDYQATSGELTFLAGETTKVVKVPMYGDTGVEATEYLKLNLSGAVNAAIVKDLGWGTIVDNDAATGTPKISVSDGVFDESSAFATFTVTLDRPSTGQVKVDAATSSATAAAVTDYDSAGSQTLVFAAGEVSKTVTVALRGDTVAEGTEVFDLVLSSPVNATIDDVRGHAYIPRSDAATSTNPTIAAAAIAADEAGTYVEFAVSLSAPSAQLVSFDYATANVTASYNYDYQGTSGTLTFAPGQVAQTIRVPIYNDTGVEGNETFNLLLSNAVNGTIGTPTVTATILDDDDSSTTPFTNVGTENGDILVGRAGSNIVSGGNGDDLLDGLAGVQMSGGAGNDVYIVESSTDVVTEAASAGTDRVISYLTSYTLGANLENLTLGNGAVTGIGNSANNAIAGNSGANTLDGGTGADAMTGGSGDDTYLVDNAGDTTVEVAGGGIDTVKTALGWTLAAEVEKLVLTGTGNVNATGNSLNNTLTGNAGNNTLSGGTGADAMTGGAGNDIYVVDNAGDTTVEAASGGIDTVQSSISWTLGTELEKLTLTGTADINATGNTLDNTLTGNAGANTLDGGTGIDAMTGGSGDDTYIVDNAGDTTVEASGGGIDTVKTALSWTLAAEVDKLTLTGTGNVNGTGNGLNNTLVGNVGNNILNGGTGADAMTGGAGNDLYLVDNAGDTTVEAAGGGTDSIQSSITWTLATDVENLSLSGTAAIDATGNAGNNALTGNSAANKLTGGAGTDTLTGGTGADTFVFTSKTGIDTVTDFKAVDDTFAISMAGIHIGDGDAIVEGATTRAAPGGFATSAELVVFTTDIAGAITTTSAAAAIGSATSAYAAGADVLFVVDNGTQSGIFQFHAAAADATVSAAELTQIAIVSGDATTVTDYAFQP